MSSHAKACAKVRETECALTKDFKCVNDLHLNINSGPNSYCTGNSKIKCWARDSWITAIQKKLLLSEKASFLVELKYLVIWFDRAENFSDVHKCSLLRRYSHFLILGPQTFSAAYVSIETGICSLKADRCS